MYYSQSHEWIKLDGKIGTVGVSDFAQKELGDIVYVELPKVEKELNAGDEAAVLESTKAASDVYTPVSGRVVEVNESLKNAVEKINQAAEGEGWLFKIELSNLEEVNRLLNQEAYRQMVSGK